MISRYALLVALTLVVGCFTDTRGGGRRRPVDVGAADAGPGFDVGPGFDAGGRPDVGPLPDAGFSRCGDSTVSGNEVCDGDPGCAADCLSATFTGSLSETDGTWSRNTASCSAGGSGAYYYDTQVFAWRGETASLRFVASWADFDGYLHAFDGAFNVSAPTSGCLVGDDDEGGTSSSAVEVELSSGDQVELVLSTFSAGSTGDWSLTVMPAL